MLKICTYCLLSHFVTKITIKKFLSDFRDKLCMKIHAKCIMHIATVLFQREINLLVATTRLFLDCYKRSGTTTYDSISFSFRNALNKKAMRRERVKGVREKKSGSPKGMIISSPHPSLLKPRRNLPLKGISERIFTQLFIWIFRYTT